MADAPPGTAVPPRAQAVDALASRFPANDPRVLALIPGRLLIVDHRIDDRPEVPVMVRTGERPDIVNVEPELNAVARGWDKVIMEAVAVVADSRRAYAYALSDDVIDAFFRLKRMR